LRHRLRVSAQEKRREYHRKTAEVLQERFTETAEAQPELVANHFSEAGLIEDAVPYWMKAGQKAIERSANQEAIRHLSNGLDLLRGLPETPQRVQQELMFQMSLGTASIATRGFASAEVERIYARARQLCQQAGEVLQLFPVLRGLWLFYTSRGQHLTARELAQECLRLSHKGDAGLQVEAHYITGLGLIALGDFVQALQHLQQTIHTYDPQQHGSHAYVYGHDPAAIASVQEGWALWFLGYPQQALKRCAEGMAMAQKLGHPYTLASAGAFAAWLYQCCRDKQEVEELASLTLNLSTQHEFAFYLPWAMMLRGWARTEASELSAGIADMRAGLDFYRNIGGEVFRPAFLSLLVEAYRKTGQVEEGLAVVNEAMAAVAASRESWWEAELYRLKGELMLDQCSLEMGGSEDRTGIEECFCRALNIARSQHAKSLELRATKSLARLLVSQGRSDEARNLLTEIYSWFTEGFDTVDLKEAKALLERLGGTGVHRA